MAMTAAIGSMVVGVLGTFMSARAQSNAARYNAQVAENQATLATQAASENERRQRVLDKKNLGAIRAAYGASGITLDGSPQDVIEESAMNAELNALTIRHGGAVTALGYQNSARLDRYRAGSAMAEGGITAAGQLLAGGSEIYDQVKLTRT